MGSFREELRYRYQQIQYAKVAEQQYKVADLAAVYGSKRNLAEAYAKQYGVKLNSAQKALSRLERVERGEVGKDIRTGAKEVRDRLNALGKEKLKEKDYEKPRGGGSGLGGGSIHFDGMIAINGNQGDTDYEEERDFTYDFDEYELDELAEIAYEKGEQEAANAFFDIYGFDEAEAFDYDVDIS